MSSRRRQVVSTKEQRRDVILWMMKTVEDEGTHNKIASRAIDAFTSVFWNDSKCCKLRNAHRKKAQSWWNRRHLFLSKIATEEDCRMYVTTTNGKGVCRKKFPLKATSGRGRKRK